MSSHQSNLIPGGERLDLRGQAWPLYAAAQALAVIGLVGAILLGWHAGDGFRRFFFAYMVAYVFFLAIALGGLFFVLIQHVTKAGWSVDVRRIAEWLAAALPLLAALAAPIIVSIVLSRLSRRSGLYPWALPDWRGTGFKAWWLQPGFFIGRMVAYLAIWAWLGAWYWKQSVKQDVTGDIKLTLRMQAWSGVGLVLYGLSLTFAGWDWIMSLDPRWYSTIFGVYYFAGCAVAGFAAILIVARLLQSRGLLLKSITVEHYHDLGKLLFAFTFFWGYIAFSQYILYWYANIPEETEWYLHRGASTLEPRQWSPIVLALLFGHLLIPFAGLMSRHVKRNAALLNFWAVWMLVFCWLDVFWLVMPQFDAHYVHLGLIDLAAFCGVGGLFVAFVLRTAAQNSLRVLRDPRIVDSLTYENF